MHIHVPIMRFLSASFCILIWEYTYTYNFHNWYETMQYFTQNKPWNNPVTVVYGTCISSEKSALIPKNITFIDTE